MCNGSVGPQKALRLDLERQRAVVAQQDPLHGCSDGFPDASRHSTPDLFYQIFKALF